MHFLSQHLAAIIFISGKTCGDDLAVVQVICDAFLKKAWGHHSDNTRTHMHMHTRFKLFLCLTQGESCHIVLSHDSGDTNLPTHFYNTLAYSGWHAHAVCCLSQPVAHTLSLTLLKMLMYFVLLIQVQINHWVILNTLIYASLWSSDVYLYGSISYSASLDFTGSHQ